VARRPAPGEHDAGHPEGGLMHWLGNIAGRLYRGEVSFDFVGRQKLWYMISGVILLVSVVALLVRGLDYSVDFKGGSEFEFSAPGASTSQILSTVVAAGGGADASIQSVKPPGKAPLWEVQTNRIPQTTAQHVADALAAKYHLSPNAISVTFIGPSWGSQISQKALKGLIAFLIVIVIYLSIAFEWRMASAALVALVHDIVITIGVYALTGFQVSPATVIGLLTILGYSLYDTVVVFDKVRENTAGILGTRRTTYSQAANLALNQTLVRSINTSLIALLPVTAILVVSVTLLGNGELKDLALVLFIGMLSGTYSSICIATPVLADLKERQPQYKQLARQVAVRASGGRAAQRKTRAAVPGTAAGNGASAAAGPAAVDEDEGTPDPTLTGDEPVPAARAAAGGSVPRGASARPGPRQQPRRTSAAKRRPGGKKKRR